MATNCREDFTYTVSMLLLSIWTIKNLIPCSLSLLVSFILPHFSVDECVGYCWLTLGRISVSLEKNNPTVFWAEVLPYDENGKSGFGEVLFSLTYLSQAQRLTMNIFKVRNLRCHTDGGISIRVTLVGNEDRRLKRKKTGSRRNVRNAQFNESLTFGVPKRSLCDISLEVEVRKTAIMFSICVLHILVRIPLVGST
ncbi:unnamed protein product [Angiostrongylus costaricensis]|uniref:C2 domain-containing protein n=1 Tax=Angiostrongylus costaricensis TaxID=334426 RepID=A0A0R3PH44_ANGCS|nr:unnamed protein product [Angiostrongylus costaricensis]